MVVTLCTEVPVQPLAGSVTVTVYVPAAVTDGFADAELKPAGPLQLYVAPGAEDEPLRFTDVTAQVIVCAEPVLTFGGVVLAFTVCIAVAVQPLDGSVTVTV